MPELKHRSSTLNHSPAEVVQQLLIDKGLGVDIDDIDNQVGGEKGKSPDWPVYIQNLVSQPSELILVRNQEGVVFAQSQYGKKLSYRGVQFIVRGESFTVGYRKSNQLYSSLTEEFTSSKVRIQDTAEDYTEYQVERLVATSDVISLGEERDADSSRYVFSINFTVVLNQYSREELILDITEDDPYQSSEDNATSETTESGLVVSLLDTTTEAGKRIWKISHPSYDLMAHINSGSYSAFSANSKYLSVMRGAELNDGDWFAIDLEDLSAGTTEIFSLTSREEGANVNVNIVWGTTGSRFYELRGDYTLNRREVGVSTPVNSVALNSVIPYHGGGNSAALSYRLSIGSNEEVPALVLYDGDNDEVAIQTFDPLSLTLNDPWWVHDATTAGVSDGTCKGVGTNLTNAVSFNGGIAGKLDTSIERDHWIPSDGSTAVEVENGIYSGGYQSDDGPSFTHPAYKETMHAAGVQSTMYFWDWGSPPQINRGNRTQRWEIDMTGVAASFSEGNILAVGMHHCQIQDTHTIASMLHFTAPVTAQSINLFLLDNADGTYEQISPSGMLYRSSNGPFHSSPRPSISPDKKFAISHQYDNSTSETFLYLFEL